MAKIGPPNFTEVKIEAHHCYKCGEAFDEEEHKKTMHHAIPKSMKPKRNILIPVGLK